jgi:initiation factor 1A
MPNNKGGKNYKKSKNNVEDNAVLYEKMDDQMYGRVTKVLGNCNVMVYCNDDKERLCHIRGSMKKKCWISAGDIVLISIRDFSSDSGSGSGGGCGGINKEISKGDICAKYDPRVIYKLRQKDITINPRLFLNIESIEENNRERVGPVIEDGFIFDNAENKVGDEGDSVSGSECGEDFRGEEGGCGGGEARGGSRDSNNKSLHGSNLTKKHKYVENNKRDDDDDESFNIDDI